MQFSEILHTCKCRETRELGKKEKSEVLKALMKERLQHNSALTQPEGSHWGSRNALGLGRSPSMFRLYQVPENATAQPIPGKTGFIQETAHETASF